MQLAEGQCEGQCILAVTHYLRACVCVIVRAFFCFVFLGGGVVGDWCKYTVTDEATNLNGRGSTLSIILVYCVSYSHMQVAEQ